MVFSGDLGPLSMPLIREYDPFDQADVVFLESTYGDREHRPYSETVAEFETIVKQVAESGGKILVPTFAIGRSQQMLYHLAVMFLRKDVRPFPVVLDSPMAIEASKVYTKYPDLYDEELVAWKKRGLLPLNPAYFTTSSTPEESKKLNDMHGPCDSGRGRHVQCRPDSTSSGAQSTEPLDARADRRLSGRRLARPATGRGSRIRDDFWPAGQGERQSTYAQRVQRSCGAKRVAQLVLEARSLPSTRDAHAW